MITATDGDHALAQFRNNKHDIQLMILDVVMPKLSGPQVYEKIYAEKPELPVIFVTGYSADIGPLAKAQAKGLPVLQKPYAPADLTHKVREALDQGRAALVSHGGK